MKGVGEGVHLLGEGVVGGEHDGAGTAEATAAADLGAGEALAAQVVCQALGRVGPLHLHLLAVQEEHQHVATLLHLDCLWCGALVCACVRQALCAVGVAETTRFEIPPSLSQPQS